MSTPKIVSMNRSASRLLALAFEGLPYQRQVDGCATREPRPVDIGIRGAHDADELLAVDHRSVRAALHALPTSIARCSSFTPSESSSAINSRST